MQAQEQSDSDEVERLRRLDSYGISRTPPERQYDDIVASLADALEVPIAFICATEEHCHWFKARIGIDLEEVPRSISFCDHTIKASGILVVPDATLDDRFSRSPMVTGFYHIKFYAGITLRDADGFALGTLAVADTASRQITEKQTRSLERMARIALDAMELKKTQITLKKSIIMSEVARDHAVSYQKELRQVIDCLPQAIALLDGQNKLILWNKSYDVMFPEVSSQFKPGVAIEEIYRTALRDPRYYEPMNPDDEESWLENRLARFRQEGSLVEQNFGDGRWIRFDQHPTPDGKTICVRTDITHDRNAEDSFRLLFSSNPVPMFVYDQSNLSYLDVNQSALDHYGYTRDVFLRMTHADIRPARDRQRMLDHLKDWTGISLGEQDWVHLKADGSEVTMNIYARPLMYRSTKAVLVAAVDVTERRKSEARVRYLADFDSLTDLPNRRHFLELLEGGFPKSTKNHYYTAIILLDIDEFKSVNDTLGHHVGDQLLVEVANRIGSCICDPGIVARLGGDEFAVLLPMLVDIEEARVASAQLLAAFAKPVRVLEHDILVGVSLGISFSIDETIPASVLLMNADLALHQAKSDGRGSWRVYEPQMSLQMLVHRELEQDLRQALARNKLTIHYQPLLDLTTSVEVGFEALIRWDHPEKGMVSPVTFIPIAESSGLIVPIGKWVLEQACIQAMSWRSDLVVAVNISPTQFQAGALVETVANALKRSGLPAHRLELEITESNLLEKSSETLAVLRGLKELGVVIALDDFGTGYSGLGYLNSFPIDKIKIDRSFVRDLGQRTKSDELVRAAIAIGQNLGITTLAEGIETATQLQLLQSMGCQQGQGFLFSRAIPANEIAEALMLQHSVLKESRG